MRNSLLFHLLGVEHVLSLARDLGKILLISYQHLEVHHLLVQQHTSNLAHVLRSVRLLDARVDHVTDLLLLLIGVSDVRKLRYLFLGRKRHNSERLLSLLRSLLFVFVLRLVSWVSRILTLLGSHWFTASATSCARTILLLLLSVTVIRTVLFTTVTHHLILDLVHSRAEKLLHRLFLFSFTFGLKVNFTNPEFNINWLVSKWSCFIE